MSDERYLKCDYTVSGLMMLQLGKEKLEQIVRETLSRSAAEALAKRPDLITYRDERMLDARTYSLHAAVYAITDIPRFYLPEIKYTDRSRAEFIKGHISMLAGGDALELLEEIQNEVEGAVRFTKTMRENKKDMA